MQKPKLLLSIDLESFIHMQPTGVMPESERKQLDAGYILAATHQLLQMLSQANVKMTFFVLGEIYNWYPDLVREVKQAGHEIAWHSHSHSLIKTEAILIAELAKSAEFLAEFQPKGFRAPQLDLFAAALEMLTTKGFLYDSSSYSSGPVTKIGGLWEIPVSVKAYSRPVAISFPGPLTVSLLTKGIPVGSGLFLGLLGERAVTMASPYVGILHPWQIIAPPTTFQHKVSHALKNPLFTPYLRNARHLFADLLANYEIIPLLDYLQSETGELSL
jgi:hypothetical protein